MEQADLQGELSPDAPSPLIDPETGEVTTSATEPAQTPKRQRRKRSDGKTIVEPKACDELSPLLGETPLGEKPTTDPFKLAARFGGIPFNGAAPGGTPANAPSNPAEPPIKFYSMAQLKKFANEPINWAVENLFTESARVVIAAEQKVGKTFVICALATAVASGVPFLGKLKVSKPGSVLIIAGEDDRREMARRIDRMCRANDLDMEELPIVFGDAHGARLNRPFEIELIRDRVKLEKHVLVIADPLARLMEGDENSKECVAQVLNPAGKIADDLGCSFCFVHHLGKPDREGPRSSANRVRGSSDIASWFTCGVFVSGSMDDGELQFEVIQRTSGSIPHKFPVKVVENQAQSVYGRGAMKLIASFEEAGRRTLHETTSEDIERDADRIFGLLEEAAAQGMTRDEVMRRLRVTSNVVSVALERLILDRGTVAKRKNFDGGLSKDRFFAKKFAGLSQPSESDGSEYVLPQDDLSDDFGCQNVQCDLFTSTSHGDPF